MPLFSVNRKFNRSNPACKITSTAVSPSQKRAARLIYQKAKDLCGVQGKQTSPPTVQFLRVPHRRAQNTAIMILLLRREAWEMGPNCAC